MRRLLRLLKEIALVVPYEIVLEKIVEVLLVGWVALQIPSQDRQSLQSASVLGVMDQLLVQIVAIVLPDLVQLEMPILLHLLLDLVQGIGGGLNAHIKLLLTLIEGIELHLLLERYAVPQLRRVEDLLMLLQLQLLFMILEQLEGVVPRHRPAVEQLP